MHGLLNVKLAYTLVCEIFAPSSRTHAVKGLYCTGINADVAWRKPCRHNTAKNM